MYEISKKVVHHIHNFEIYCANIAVCSLVFLFVSIARRLVDILKEMLEILFFIRHIRGLWIYENFTT